MVLGEQVVQIVFYLLLHLRVAVLVVVGLLGIKTDCQVDQVAVQIIN